MHEPEYVLLLIMLGAALAGGIIAKVVEARKK